MAKPVINAQDALDLILAGATNADLMSKYQLSAKGLRSLLIKLIKVGALKEHEVDGRVGSGGHSVSILLGHDSSVAPNNENPGKLVKATDALNDIKNGFSDAELMEKYKLSAKGVESLFDKLLETGLISEMDLDKRDILIDQTVDVDNAIKRLGLAVLPKLSEAPAPSEVPAKCIACGASQTMELEECPVCGVNIEEFKRKQFWERKKAGAAWVCPACNRPQEKEYDECPACGVIVSKYQKNKAEN